MKPKDLNRKSNVIRGVLQAFPSIFIGNINLPFLDNSRLIASELCLKNKINLRLTSPSLGEKMIWRLPRAALFQHSSTFTKGKK